MKKLLYSIGMLMGLVAVVWGVEKEAGSTGVADEGTHAFLGADLLAEYRSSFFPVLSADNRGLIVETEKGTKRVRFDSRCSIQLKVEFSKNFVEIENLEYTFGSTKKNRRVNESMALKSVLATQGEFQGSYAREQRGESGPDSSDTGGAFLTFEEKSSDYETFQRDLDNLAEDASDNALGEQFAQDIIDLRMTLTPELNVENAYCAFVITHIKNDPYSRLRELTESVVNVRKVGDLIAGEPKKVSFRARLNEGSYDGADCQVFLFSGDGEGIVLSNSQALKRLSKAELARYKEIEAKASQNKPVGN